MTPHAPKTAALEALAADVLSDEGTRRIRAHLRDCEVCREHFATIHVYRESQEFIAQAEPEVGGKPIGAFDWSKMEVALAREARSQSQQNLRSVPAANDGRYPWLLGGAIAVAAAALVAIGVSNGWWAGASQPAERVVATHDVPEAPSTAVARALAASGTVSMIAGDATFASDFADSATESLSVGQRVTNGVVMTGALGQAAFVLERPAPGPDGAPVALANVTLGANAQLSIGEVTSPSEATDGDPTALVTSRLTAGRTTIDAFEASSRVVVLAGAYRVEIRAARCTIDLSDPTADGAEGLARVSVGAMDAEHGEVVVVDGAGQRTEMAVAGEWASRETGDERVELAELPLALADGPIVQVSFPEATRFEIGETSYEAGPSLALRVPVGPLDVRAFDRAGHTFRAHIDVGPDGLALSPDQLEPVRPRIVGFLPPEDITPIVQRSQRTLQRCYEQAMRMHPEISGSSMRARVTLDSRGAVRVVQIEGESVPPSLEQCVRQEAANWSFPPPGGPMTFDLPLRFRTRL